MLEKNWYFAWYAAGENNARVFCTSLGQTSDFADPEGDKLTVVEEWFHGGSPTEVDFLGPTFVFLPDGMTMQASVPRRAEAEGAVVALQTSIDLLNWSPAAGVSLISNERLAGSSPAIDILTFEVGLSPAPQFFRFAFGE